MLPLQEKGAEKGKHSTFGIGQTCPAVEGARTLDDGVLVPMGKGVPNQYLTDNLERLLAESKVKKPALLYNEFIVYDTSQVQIK